MGQPNANARRAALVLAAAAAVSFFCYAWCYLRFRQHALDLPGHQRAGGCGWWRPPDAIAEFVTLTMARARDQKLVLLLILGLGVGLVFESGVYLFRRVERYGWVATSGRIEGAALGLPLILAFFALVGLRRAFRLPVEPAANWLFRLAETPASRTRWLRSTFSTLFCLGAVLPSPSARPLTSLSCPPERPWP